MAKDTTAATVTIKRAGEMTGEGRKAVAEWLRMHADDLEAHGSNYSARFRGRYLIKAPEADTLTTHGPA